MKRVLKPGGIIASREMFVSSSFLEPSGEDMEDAWRTFARLLQGNGGHPQMGSELKGAFLEAGFADIRASASFDHFGSAEDVAFLRGFIDDWFHSPRVVEAAAQFGLASREQFDQWRKSLDDWRDHPGAFGGFAFGEAIAVKP